MKHIAIHAVGAMLLASPAALGAPPGVVISSDPNARVEYVQFGGATAGDPCISNPCTIFSGSPAVLSVSRETTGIYSISFAPGTFSEPPTCTAIGGNNLVFALGAPSNTTMVTLEFLTPNNTGGDAYVYVTCMGPSPAR